MNACLPTFQPLANTGCCQSYIFANLSVLGVIECRDIVVLICLILIYSEFFFFPNLTYTYCLYFIFANLWGLPLGRGVVRLNLSPAERA